MDSRTIKVFARHIAPLALALSASLAGALDLGPLHWRNGDGKPNFAEIELRNAIDPNPAMISVSLATPEAYAAAGLAYHPGFARSKLSAQGGANGQTVIRIEQLPQDAETLDLLIVVNNRQTVALAEYRVNARASTQDVLPSPAGTLQLKPRPAEAKPRPAETTANAAKTPAATTVDADAAAVRDAIQAWAKAWSARDIDAYASAYTADYPGPGIRQSHADWLAQRRKAIEPRHQITVEVEALRLVRRDENTFIASFRQRYRSDGPNDISRKSLELVRDNGRWLIRRERNLTPPPPPAVKPETPPASAAQ